MAYFTILLALFAGIGDPFLALTLKKPKENHCFWLRTLKNLRKTFVFVFPRASGDPGGTIGPTTPKKLYITNSRSTAQAAVMLVLWLNPNGMPNIFKLDSPLLQAGQWEHCCAHIPTS